MPEMVALAPRDHLRLIILYDVYDAPVHSAGSFKLVDPKAVRGHKGDE